MIIKELQMGAMQIVGIILFAVIIAAIIFMAFRIKKSNPAKDAEKVENIIKLDSKNKENIREELKK